MFLKSLLLGIFAGSLLGGGIGGIRIPDIPNIIGDKIARPTVLDDFLSSKNKSTTLKTVDDFFGDGNIPGLSYRNGYNMEVYFDHLMESFEQDEYFYNEYSADVWDQPCERYMGNTIEYIVSILSYYDTFLNDDIVPEEYDISYKNTTSDDFSDPVEAQRTHSPYASFKLAESMMDYFRTIKDPNYFWTGFPRFDEIEAIMKHYQYDKKFNAYFPHNKILQSLFYEMPLRLYYVIDYYLSIGVPVLVALNNDMSSNVHLVYAKTSPFNDGKYEYKCLSHCLGYCGEVKTITLDHRSNPIIMAFDFTNASFKKSNNYVVYNNDGQKDTTVKTKYCPTSSTFRAKRRTNYPVFDVLNNYYAEYRKIAYCWEGNSLLREESTSNLSQYYTIDTDTITIKQPIYVEKKFECLSFELEENGIEYLNLLVINGTLKYQYTYPGPIIIFDIPEKQDYEITLTYDLDGGSKVDANKYPSSLPSCLKTYELDSPVKNGYYFLGWQIEGKDGLFSSIDQNVGENVTYNLKAIWDPKSYSINYDLDGGTKTYEERYPESFKYGTDQIYLDTPTKPGYVFVGWSVNGGGTIDRIYTNAYDFDINLKAKWQVETYSISYTDGVNPISTSNPTSYNISTTSFRLKDPGAPIGKLFDGWYDQNGKKVTTFIPSQYLCDVTLTAVFISSTFSITYDYNGGHLVGGQSNPSTYTYSSNYVALNNPSKSGYIFVGYQISGRSSLITSIQPFTRGNLHLTAIYEEHIIPTYNDEVIHGLTAKWLKENYLEHYFIGSPGDNNHRAWTPYHSSLDLNYVSNVRDVDCYLDYLLQNYQFDFDHHTTSGIYFRTDYFVNQDSTTGRWYTSEHSGSYFVDTNDTDTWPCLSMYNGELDFESIPANNDMCKIIKIGESDYVFLTEIWPCCNNYDDILLISNKYDPNFERFAQYNEMPIDAFINQGDILYDAPAVKVLNIDRMLYIINDVTEDPDVRIIANSNGSLFGSQLDYLQRYYDVVTNPQILANTGLILANSKQISKFISMLSLELDDIYNVLGAQAVNDIYTIIELMDFANQSDWEIFLALYSLLFDIQLAANEIDVYCGAKVDTLSYLIRFGFFMAQDIIEQMMSSCYLDIIPDYTWEYLMGPDSPCPSYLGTSVVENSLYLFQDYINNNPFFQ